MPIEGPEGPLAHRLSEPELIGSHHSQPGVVVHSPVVVQERGVPMVFPHPVTSLEGGTHVPLHSVEISSECCLRFLRDIQCERWAGGYIPCGFLDGLHS